MTTTLRKPRARPAAAAGQTTGKRRVALSRDRIESEALSLIEESGIDQFSTRKLGQRLGCEAMSIYHYFPSKAHILDSLADRVLAAMPIPPQSLSPGRRLRELAYGWRRLARQYPRFYLWLSLRQWNSEVGARYMDEILACFYDAGLPPELAARGLRILGYYVQGATQDESSGYAAGPSALSPVPPDVMAARHPRLVAASQFYVPSEYDTTFEVGYAALLRELGIE